MIISVLNQKGGVGKTTISVNIAACLAKQNKRVLLVDADPQASALDWSAARETDAIFSVIGLPKPTIHKEIKLMGRDYDFVVIDGPPRVTDLARSAIMASDVVLIPVQPSPYDIWASDEVVQLINEASVFNEMLKCYFVINRKITNTAIARDVRDALSNYAVETLETAITQRVVFAEAASQGLAVVEIDKGMAKTEIENLVNELLSKVGGAV